MNIPAEHWINHMPQREVEMYRDHWERHLREQIAKQPDPAKRFTEWLDAQVSLANCFPGVRCTFIEQPYLGWAEAVERALEFECRREAAASIAHLQARQDERRIGDYDSAPTDPLLVCGLEALGRADAKGS